MRALIWARLRIIPIVILLGYIHLATILADTHFYWIFSPHGDFFGDLTTYAIQNAAAVIIIGSTIFLASWIIFLLVDLSRLEGMCTRLGLQTRNQAAPTKTDVVFVGLFVFTAIILLYVFIASV